ncbi:probable 4-coumarate--CoA ligase 1 [Neocloeon triangulifer]|uniref:probable 4-coumarate--CoA ligase 1 n=1 Tax=Neocloeon triangulifer TaxID=2078957 RepID=UPI00286F3AEF|nr:probable 4-coumarate--CoA ligase 1 [Neocloeon triangulifer]
MFVARRSVRLVVTPKTELVRLFSASNTLLQNAYEAKKHNGIYDPETHIVRSPYESVLPDCNIPEYVWRNYKNWENSPAMTCGLTGKSFTYGQMYATFDKFSINLPAIFGLKQGDVVGLVLPNMPEYAVTFYGCLSAGLVVSPANPLYTADELLKQFTDAKVRLVVTIPELADRVKEALGKMPAGGAPMVLTDGAKCDSKETFAFEEILSKQVKGANRLAKPGPEALAVLPYSSGTTGVPKGVVITHRNMVAGLVIANHAEAIADNGENSDGLDSTLAVIPFYHIYGAVIIVGSCLSRGAHVITVPRFEPVSFSKVYEHYKPSHMFLVPPLVHFMARSPTITKEAMSRLRLTVSGAAPLSKQIMDEYIAKSGPMSTFKTGYGMTESTCLITTMPKDMPTCKSLSVGPPGSFTELKIIDGALKTLPLGEVGELCARGPHIISGYLKNEKATKETIIEGGWLRTGDVAFLDQYGHVNIVDRVKELIKVKGFQVSPTELEALLIKCEGVADVAVIGVPDERSGEVPKAFIVKKPGSTVTVESINEYLESKVAEYKQLRGGVKFVDAIPRSAAGKILRKNLKHF